MNRRGSRRTSRWWFPVTGTIAAATAVLLTTGLLGTGSAEPISAEPVSADAPRAAQLVWSDEFNGAAGTRPDPNKWTHETGDHGWGNNELQNYTTSTANSAHDGQGNLVITARREADGGYTSARLITKDTFTRQYGRFEARIRVPRGQGIWPAFWMLGSDFDEVGWPNSGEIDIMENIGREPGTVHGSLHGPGYSGGNPLTGSYTLPGGRALADDFHTFAVEWGPDSISWFIDDVRYQTRTPADAGGNPWVFDHPFFMLLNVAVGGNWPGYPDGTTTFPQTMTVDYVRVYDLGNGGGTDGPTGAITGIGGMCVDVAGANTANGTGIQLHPCTGHAAQTWTMAGDGTIRAYGKCLDVADGGTADGTRVQLWDCNGTPAQQWVYSSERDLVNPQANKCLDATGNSSADGTPLQIWTCAGTANQKWNVPA
ncbi:ricin-type beta-trefoil lectin domain protein [Marinactinospora rubrisoli]|uniref:Ricin-type beta-trefoil lectin domain protein n=1 Tax=Marinactinospora rubrisoli TaxID=2715399 RepID=A0ABW2KDT7_9ACTN